MYINKYLNKFKSYPEHDKIYFFFGETNFFQDLTILYQDTHIMKSVQYLNIPLYRNIMKTINNDIIKQKKLQ